MEACGEDGVAGALQARDAARFLSAVAGTLRTNPSAFPTLKRQIATLLAEAHHGLDDFVLGCIEVALDDPAISPALAHLILDTIAELDAAEHAQRGTLQAARVLLACCASQPRLAPKVAAAFRLAAAHLSAPQQGALLDAISSLLDANATSACGVSLLLHPGFAPLRRHFHMEAVLEDLVLSAQDPVAIRLVRELGSREMQSLYVQFCLQYGQLRSANNAVKQFGLQAEFPDVERMHKAKQLEKMVSKGLWGVAGQYVGEDGELQRSLLRSMLVAGELSLAAQHQQLFGLDGEFDIHPERLAEEQERRRQQFLQLPLPPGAVRYVDSGEGLAALAAALAALLAPPHRHGSAHSPAGADGPAAAEAAAAGGSPTPAPLPSSPTAAPMAAAAAERDAELLPVLGLDLEWQPDSEKSAPPSVLQISTDSEVFVVDLLALGAAPDGEAALAAALDPALSSEAVYKVGCGIAGDCRKLAAHHPAAFAVARGCLDLSTVWRSHSIEQMGKRSTAGYRKRAGEVSLSVLAQSILGKPLDKSCQVSDWGRRPLSEQQVRYAALDAHAAVLIFRGMGQLHHPFRTRQGLARHVFSVDTRQGPAGRRGAPDNGGPNGGGGGGGGRSGDGANPGSSSGGSGGDGAGVAAAALQRWRV
ncbi:hypothetical protein ABPG75_008310 [Micractinium tetrahymenae]